MTSKLNAFSITIIVIYSFAFLLGVSGNLFVVKWFGNKRERKKAGNKLVVVLAINDLLSSIFVPMGQIHYMAMNFVSPPRAWYLGRELCYTLNGLQFTFIVATSLFLVMIALERFW